MHSVRICIHYARILPLMGILKESMLFSLHQCSFVGKEVVLLLDLELSFGGKYLSERRHFRGPQ